LNLQKDFEHLRRKKKVEEKDPGILNDLEKIMDENTSGANESLKWTNKSTYKIADELRKLQT